MIISGSENIYSIEVERVLAEHPGWLQVSEDRGHQGGATAEPNRESTEKRTAPTILAGQRPGHRLKPVVRRPAPSR